MGEAGKVDAQASVTTIVEVATSNRVIRNRCTPGSKTSNPYGSNTGRGDIRSHNRGGIPWASWERPPPQQQYRSGAQRRQYEGGDQSHWHQRRMCQRYGEKEHFPAECTETRNMPASAPQHRPDSAPSSGAQVAQYDSCPPPPWTSHEFSDGYSTSSSYGPTPPHGSYAPAPPMPPPPRPDGPPPPALPSEPDWSFSSRHSQALQAHYVPPSEFPSSVSSDWRTNGDSVGGSYLPSAFVGQPVGIDQVGDVWIGDSGTTSHLTRSADLMYGTRPPSPHRSRIILGNGSIKK